MGACAGQRANAEMGDPWPHEHDAAVHQGRACPAAWPTSPAVGSAEGLEKSPRRVWQRRTPARVWMGRSGHPWGRLCAWAGARGAPKRRDGDCARGLRPLHEGRLAPGWRASHRAKPQTQRAERRLRTALARARPQSPAVGHRTRGAYGKATLTTCDHSTPFAEPRKMNLLGISVHIVWLDFFHWPPDSERSAH